MMRLSMLVIKNLLPDLAEFMTTQEAADKLGFM